MRKMLMRSLFGALAVLLTAGTARAADVLEVKIPFPFVASGHSFPAGEYTIERAGMNEAVLMIRGDHGNRAAAFVTTRPADHKQSPADMPALQFKRDENQYKLTAVWETPTDGLSLIN